MTDLTQMAIDQAHALTAEADRLLDEVDTLLGPIAKAAAEKGDEGEIKALIKKLPRGFWRTELRALFNRIRMQH